MAAKQLEGSNGGISGEQINRYLAEIDKADDKLLALKSEHMTACKGPHERIRNVMKEARESGVNMPALRTIIAKRRAERAVELRISGLEDDDRDEFETMQEALGAFGETELGQAALGKVKRKKGGEALDTLRA
jgi:uncharacterized protein (UPF0335 family)